MAEKYREMGSAGDGMKTSSDALVEVAPVWNEIRNDAPNTINWVWCRHDKTLYKVVSHGEGGIDEMISTGLVDSSFIYFGGLRVAVEGKIRFVHVVFIPDGVSALQKGKAQLHKSAIFNSWPGSSGEISTMDITHLRFELAKKLKCEEKDLS